jgi:hypothetical protein
VAKHCKNKRSYFELKPNEPFEMKMIKSLIGLNLSQSAMVQDETGSVASIYTHDGVVQEVLLVVYVVPGDHEMTRWAMDHTTSSFSLPHNPYVWPKTFAHSQSH